MLIKFFINEKLFVSEPMFDPITNQWHKNINTDIVKQCDFVSVGNEIIKCRYPNKYTKHVEINEMYKDGNFKELPKGSLTCSNFIHFVKEKLNYECDYGNYSYSHSMLHKIFDELYVL